MSNINIIRDRDNMLLSRREVVCEFVNINGKFKKSDYMTMIRSKLKLENKVVIPIKLKSCVGKNTVTGIFYVYDDEKMPRIHISTTVLARIDKQIKSSKNDKQ